MVVKISIKTKLKYRILFGRSVMEGHNEFHERSFENLLKK